MGMLTDYIYLHAAWGGSHQVMTHVWSRNKSIKTALNRLCDFGCLVVNRGIFLQFAAYFLAFVITKATYFTGAGSLIFCFKNHKINYIIMYGENALSFLHIFSLQKNR